MPPAFSYPPSPHIFNATWQSPIGPSWAMPRAEAARSRVLIIDDDRSLLSLLRAIFVAAGFEVSICPDGKSALLEVQVNPPDVVVLDLEMPEMSGRDFYSELRALRSAAPVLILSAYGARTAQLELGAQAYAAKPFDPDDLVAVVRAMLPQG